MSKNWPFLAVMGAALLASLSGCPNPAAHKPDPPDAPSGLAAAARSQVEIRVTWKDNSDNEDELMLQYDTEADFSSANQMTLGADVQQKVVGGLSSNTNHYFRVKGRNSDGDSPRSNAAEATTPAAARGSFYINNNAVYTNTAVVALNSTVTGVVEMRFQNLGDSWSTWETYATAKSWSLPADDGTKTVNAEFRGAGGTAALSDSIVLDTEPPSAGSLVIDYGNQAYSRDTSVELHMTVTGASEMRFVNSGGSWSAWQGYAATRSWTLVAGDGSKRVYAEFRDPAGNLKEVYDDIILDTTPPTASIVINGNQAYTGGTNNLLTLSAADTTSGIPSTVYVRNASSSSWTSRIYSTNMDWTTDTGDGTKTVYFRVYDNAGNYRDAQDSLVMDTTPVNSFTINGGAASTYTASTTLNISVNGATSMRFRNHPSSTWSPWQSYATSTSWSLSSFGGTANENANEIVYAEFTDGCNHFAGANDAIYFDAIRRLRITAEYITIIYDGDDWPLGAGEIYWNFYGQDTSGAQFLIYNRSRSNHVSMNDGDTYNFSDVPVVVSMGNIPGASYRLHFQIFEADDDSPLATVTYTQASGWGVGANKSLYAGSSSGGPRGTMYYTIEAVD